MSATKLPNFIALLLAIEGSYNAGGAVSAATDGIQLFEPARGKLGALFDGSRRPPPGTAGYQQRLVPAGKIIDLPVKHEARGYGAAYSASNKPSLHRLLQIAGFDAAVTTGAGVEKWVYTPTPGPTGYSSGVAEAYAIGQKLPLQGIYADLTSITSDDGGPPVWEFLLRCIAGTLSDVAVPTVTYRDVAANQPPTPAPMSFTLGNFTGARVRKWAFKLGRTIGQRLDQNSSGLTAGFSPSGRPSRTPELTVTFEATTLQGSPFHAANAIDPYKLYENATPLAMSLQVGATQYNRFKLASSVQLMDYPEEDEDEGGALWTTRLQLNPSALNLNDDVTFTFD